MEFLAPYLSYAIPAVIILALLIVGLVMFKAINQRVLGRNGQRLGIIEFHEIDKTRRLVLVRRDEIEHLILIGGPHDLVVESGISLNAAMEDFREPAASPIPFRSAARATVFAERRPAALRPVEPPMMSQRNYEHEEN